MDFSSNSKPRVVILSLVYPPDNYSGAARPHRFAKYLQQFGYPVDVIAGTSARTPVSEGEVHRLHAQFDAAKKNSVVEKVLRKTLFPHDEGITWAARAVSFAGRWRGDTPIVLSTSPPISTHLAGLALHKRYGWKWIADFRDPLAGNPYRIPRVRACDQFLQNAIFRNASAVIANTDTVANRWVAEYPQASSKIHQIWNGFDPDEPIGPTPILSRERRYLRHVGSIYGDRYPQMLLDSVRRVVAAGRCDPASLCIELVGPIDRPLDSMPKAEWFRCIPKQVPRTEASRLLSDSDYLLLLDVTGSNTGLQVPAKIFDYVRIGRPVLACTVRNSPVDRILTQSGVPYSGLYAGDPPEEIDRRLEQFLSLPNTPVQPSSWFLKTFDGREQARSLASIVDSLHAAEDRR